MKPLTIKRPVRFSGIGLHTGKQVKVQLFPGQLGEGIIFNDRVPAHISSARVVNHSTCLMKGNERIAMVEHFLSACYGLGITDIRVKVFGEELPFGDGSSLPFTRLLKRAGLKPLKPQSSKFTIQKPIKVKVGDRFLLGVPGRKTRINCVIDLPGLGSQFFSFSLNPNDYESDVAPARTFGRPFGYWRSAVKFQTVTIKNFLYPKTPRFSNEPCRHKILDLLGDLALLSYRIPMEIFAFNPNHRLNLEFVRKLAEVGGKNEPIN